MIVTLNTTQVLEYRRIAAGLKFLRSDCTVELVDGTDVDATDSQTLRRRYLQLLDTAPPHLLPTADIADEINLTVASGFHGEAALPERCRRLVNIRLGAWQRPAFPVNREQYTAGSRHRKELNPYSVPDNSEPVAVTEPDGTLTVIPAMRGAEVARAIAVIDPGDGTYILDESLLDALVS